MRWEYKIIDPAETFPPRAPLDDREDDGQERRPLLEVLGENGWEAVGAWVEISGRPPSASIHSYPRLLLKRQLFTAADWPSSLDDEEET